MRRFHIVTLFFILLIMISFRCFKINKKSLSIISNIIIVSVIAFLFVFSIAPFNKDNALAVNSPYYRAESKKPVVCLLINVYEGADKVEAMLSILDAKQVKATFFLGGCWVKNNHSTAQKIADSYNEIGSHGYSHLDHKKLSFEANVIEMQKAEDIIESATERDIKLFAPPSGSYGKDCLKAAEHMGYQVIMWSKDTIDWRDKNSSLIISRATKNPTNGDFILMHPTAGTVEALPKIIDFYIQNGYNLVTVSEALE